MEIEILEDTIRVLQRVRSTYQPTGTEYTIPADAFTVLTEAIRVLHLELAGAKRAKT